MESKETGFDTERRPKWIAWEVTRRCNLSCIHCRSASGMDSTEGCFTRTEQALSVIDQISDYCQPVLVFTGGEPLLRPDLFTLTRHAADRGLRVGLATNGTLVTEEICERMKNSGVRIVSLSLDGASAEVHDDFRRQPGAFESTLHAAEFFRKHNKPWTNSFRRKNTTGSWSGITRLKKTNRTFS